MNIQLPDWGTIIILLDKYGMPVLTHVLICMAMIWVIIVLTEQLHKIEWTDKNIAPTLSAAIIGALLGVTIRYYYPSDLLPFMGLIASAAYSMGQEAQKRYGIDLLKFFLIKTKIIPSRAD